MNTREELQKLLDEHLKYSDIKKSELVFCISKYNDYKYKTFKGVKIIKVYLLRKNSIMLTEKKHLFFD